MKKIALVLISLGLILSACSSPTPATTEAPAPTTAPEQPTATLAPTETPTEVPPTSTPEPTATPTPAPQPISAANISGLALASVVEIPRQPNLVLDPNLSGVVGGYTSDSQHIILRTDAGVDVLSHQSLDLEAHYPGLQLINILSDGRFAALQGGSLVFVEPLSGEMESVGTDVNFSGQFAVSPTGEKAASAVDSKTVRLYSLTGGQPLDIPIKNSELPEKLQFTGDGVNLVLEFISNSSNSRFEVYDTSAAQKLYEYPTYRAPEFSTDGKYFVAGDMNGLYVYDTPTAKVVGTAAWNVIYHRGVPAEGIVKGALIEDRIDLTDFFLVGGPETGIGFYVHQKTVIDNPAGQWNTDLYHTDNTFESYVLDFTTGVQKFVFSGYGADQMAAGFGATDGSTFLLINKSGELALHNLKDGSRITLSDRYTVGGPELLSPDGSQVGWSNLKGVYVYDWQAGKSVLEQGQPLPLSQSALVSFLPEGRLLVESTPGGGVGLDIWNIASGQIETTVPALADCSADAVGTYVLCMVPSSQARRIIAVDDPDKIVFSTNDPNITVLSPTGDSYATCKPGSGSITYKNYESGIVTIAQPCQPMVYSPDGTLLVLQNGVVVNLPSGESTLTLEADASGKVFSSETSAAFFGLDFILIGNRAFDSASGKLLAELPVSGALGFALSDDGLTLNVLTGQGMEQWQVTQ